MLEVNIGWETFEITEKVEDSFCVVVALLDSDANEVF